MLKASHASCEGVFQYLGLTQAGFHVEPHLDTFSYWLRYQATWDASANRHSSELTQAHTNRQKSNNNNPSI